MENNKNIDQNNNQKDIGVVINGILFKDEDCKEYVEEKPFVWDEGLKPNARKIKEDLIAQVTQYTNGLVKKIKLKLS